MNYETQLLGGVLAGYPNIPELARIVSPGDFWQPIHEKVWRAMLAVHREGRAIDPGTVYAQMGADAHSLPGGPTYLVDLAQTVVAAPNASFYAEKVFEARIWRDIDGMGANLQQLAGMRDDMEPRDAVKRVKTWADDIEFRSAEDGNGSDWALEQVIDVAENGEPDPRPTPWTDLTDLLGGTYPGELITVAARPGVGKTLMLENWASFMAANGFAVKFFSMEMSAKELTQRRMAHTAQVVLNSLRMGGERVSEQDWHRINRAVPFIQQHPIDYATRTQTIDTISDLSWEFAKQARNEGRKVGGIFVDYCQLIKSVSRRSASRQQDIGEITRGLKLLAGELECPVLMGAQLNRQSQQRQDPTPRLEDMRESGDIEQDSNVVIMLHEEAKLDGGLMVPTGDLQVLVPKSRNTSKGAMKLKRYGHYSRLAA